MTFTFHKGKHRAWPLYWLCWWPLLIKPDCISRRVSFSFSAKYNLQGEDQDDHNKLFGITHSMNPHHNSARVGWRYDNDINRFILSAYCYINGERQMEDICEVVAGRQYDCDIILCGSEYTFQVRQVDNGKVFRTANIKKGHNRKNGWLLGPYFGGNQTAPNKMTLEMKKI